MRVEEAVAERDGSREEVGRTGARLRKRKPIFMVIA